jgi:hypothetical protein
VFGGLFGTLDAAAIGNKRLAPWEAVDRVELVAQHKRQALADPGDGAQTVEGLRIMHLGGLDAIQSQVGQQAVVSVAPCAVHLDPLRDGRRGKARSHAGSARLVGEFLAELREVGLTVGLLDRSQARCPLAHAMPPAEQVPGRTPLGRLGSGLGQPATAAEDSALGRIDLVVFRFAPVDRLHREGAAQDEGKALVRTAVGAPGPR